MRFVVGFFGPWWFADLRSRGGSGTLGDRDHTPMTAADEALAGLFDDSANGTAGLRVSSPLWPSGRLPTGFAPVPQTDEAGTNVGERVPARRGLKPVQDAAAAPSTSSRSATGEDVVRSCARTDCAALDGVAEFRATPRRPDGRGFVAGSRTVRFGQGRIASEAVETASRAVRRKQLPRCARRRTNPPSCTARRPGRRGAATPMTNILRAEASMRGTRPLCSRLCARGVLIEGAMPPVVRLRSTCSVPLPPVGLVRQVTCWTRRTSTSAVRSSYEVQPGDTLDGIAAHFRRSRKLKLGGPGRAGWTLCRSSTASTEPERRLQMPASVLKVPDRSRSHATVVSSESFLHGGLRR